MTGEVRIDDPDGIVVDARYVVGEECGGHLATSPPWVRDPLGAWLAERWDEPRTFRYRIEGHDLATLRVERLS